MKRFFRIVGKCLNVMVYITGLCTCMIGMVKLLEHHQQKKFYNPDPEA